MTRCLRAALFLVWCLPLAAEAHTLRVTHPEAAGGILELEGVSGTTSGPLSLAVELEIPPGSAGVNAFELGLSHDPNVLEVLSATLVGTAVESASFAAVDVVGAGVVASVSLDADPSVVLAPGTTSVVLFADYRGTYPKKDTTVQTRLRLVDGLEGPQGAVTTRLEVWDGGTTAFVSPTRESLILLLSGFEWSDLFDLSLEAVGGPAGSDPHKVTGYVRPGSKPVYAVLAFIDSKLPADETSGAQGWSLSIAHDAGVLDLTSLTTDGTEAGRLIRGGFERHETINNSSGLGLVSAVVLSFTAPVFLSPQGRTSVLLCRYALAADTSVEGAQIQGGVYFRDKLRGVGQPVNNVVTVRGESNRPRLRRDLLFELTVGIPPKQPFIRSDANNDGRPNIADAIWIAEELFLRGRQTACFYAADANGDSRKDLSDVAFVVQYQFLGGLPPPAPYPACGVIEEQVAEKCPVGSTRCP